MSPPEGMCLYEIINGWYQICRDGVDPNIRVQKENGLWKPSRIMPDGMSCIEGDRDTMIGVAIAIIEKDDYHSRRCHVDVEVDFVNFYSPRNSNGSVCRVSATVAETFAMGIITRWEGIVRGLHGDRYDEDIEEFLEG